MVEVTLSDPPSDERLRQLLAVATDQIRDQVESLACHYHDWPSVVNVGIRDDGRVTFNVHACCVAQQNRIEEVIEGE
jgi:hypothetical protein